MLTEVVNLKPRKGRSSSYGSSSPLSTIITAAGLVIAIEVTIDTRFVQTAALVVDAIM